MNQHQVRNWNVLTWNVSGLNSTWKWDSIKNKVLSTQCDIICFQETKKDSFDSSFLRKICPIQFDSFDFLPSVGASGGILIPWKSSFFSRSRLNSGSFASDAGNIPLTIEFCSNHDNSKWLLTCVYGPCTAEGKGQFLNWLKNIQVASDVDWMLLGDFNLIRKEDRNRPSGDLAEIFRFNAAISQLGINEIVLQGRKYTWSNMQPSLFWKNWIGSSLQVARPFLILALLLRLWIWSHLIIALA